VTHSDRPGLSPPLSPADWPSEPERRYARRQAGLAEQCDLDATSRTVDTDTAGRIHVLEAGDSGGAPVVLLHGITAPAAYWLPLAPALTDRYHLYAPDMPGEGLSAKPSYRGRDLRSFVGDYLEEFLTALNLDRVHLIGHSLGGWQAFVLALDSAFVDRLCLVGAPVGLSRDFPLLPRLLTVRGLNRLLFRAMTAGDPVASARAWTSRFNVVDDSAVPDAFYDLYAARQDVPELQRSLRSLMTESGSFGRMDPRTDLSEEIVDVERPTAFVWGSADYYWPPAIGREVADRMADAEFHELPDHGHAPWMEPGGAAETRVRSFLDG
jgi:pimeloyl-ACP methyl ester carboxylesterase